MKLRTCYLTFLALSTLAVSASADQVEPIVIARTFAVVGDTTTLNVPNTAFYDFKTISTTQIEPVVHDFVLRNTGASPINVQEVRVSCDCITATLDNGAQGDYKPINPGENLTVHVSIDTKSLYPGKTNKVIWLFFEGQRTPAFTMNVSSEIIAPATFEPNVLDFGDAPLASIKKGLSKKLTLTTDTAVYGQKPPEPVSLKGLVKIKRDASPTKTAGTMMVRSYDVTLSSKVGIGLFDDMISLPQAKGIKTEGLSLAVTGNAVPEAPKTVPGAKEADQLPRAEDDRLATIGLPLPTVQVGQNAPDFSVVDCNGRRWNLRNLRGARNVLLTFFPKCFTGGCANHLSSLRDHQSEIALSQTQIIAVSVDPAEGEKGQKAFAERWSFDFPLVPDTSRALCKLYGAVQNDDERAARMTFLIDKRGIVRYIDTNVMVRTHGADMVDKIRELGLK